MYQDNRHVNYQIAHQQPVMYAGVSTTHQPQQQPQQPHTKIVFVGNLSYFCEDHHLHELFSEYGQVENARVMRSDDNTRSLMFGFVTMHNANQAKEMERIFNGHMFMGRKLRVALSDKRENTRPWNDQSNPGIQVHISFCSFFDIAEEEQRKNILRPTESFIRRTLVDQGNFIDVTIKEYQIHDNLQEGYGFITVPSIEDAIALSTSFKQIASQGITLNCTLTHKHNPHPRVKKNHNKAPRTITPPSPSNNSSDKEDSSISGKSENVSSEPASFSASSFHQNASMPTVNQASAYAAPEIIPFHGPAFTPLVAPNPPPPSFTMPEATAMYQHFQNQQVYASQVMVYPPNVPFAPQNKNFRHHDQHFHHTQQPQQNHQQRSQGHHF